MNFISGLIDKLKNIIFLRILMRKALYFFKWLKFEKNGLGVKVDDKVFVFSSYNGRSYSCSPKAIYEYMLTDSYFDDCEFIWLFEDESKYKFLEEKKNTKVFNIKSAQGERYLHRAKYWIINFRAYDSWYPRKNQIYIQCWHGTPLKRLGFDISLTTNVMNSVREIHDKYISDAKKLDYIISPCKFSTEKFETAWNLKSLNKSDPIIEVGYPRDDFLLNYKESDVQRIKNNLGIENTDKKIILYTPTWRDNQHEAGKGYVYSCPVDFDYLKQKLQDEYIIIFRAHYLVANTFDFEKYKGFIYNASDYDDINELYIISDMLITDYSSTMFDYAVLNRPMLFYMYDMETYRDEIRGFYLDIEDLPGAISKNEEELVEDIEALDAIKDRTEERIKEFNSKFNYLNDGNASRRFVEAVIKK